ncbi:MAG: acyltransferase [Bacillota bacterium]|nr:acyltransferase [Bacillota bacterium]
MNRNYNFVRVLGVFSVILYHLNEVYFVSDVLMIGGAGVYFSLALTGFLYGIYHSDKSDFIFPIKDSYFYKKILKFYPVHFLSFINGLIYYYLINMQFSYKTIIIAITNLLLLQSWVPSQDYYFSFNGASWYLSSTMFFYFLSPILNRINKILKKKGIILCLLFIMIVLPIFKSYCYSVLSLEFNIWLFYINPLFNVLLIYIALAVGILIKDTNNRNKIIISSLMFIGSFLYLIVSGGISNEIAAVLMAISFLTLLSTNYKLISIIFSNKIFDFLSKISLYAYLIHQPIINIISYYLRLLGMNNVNKCFVFCLLIILILSTVIYYFDNNIRECIKKE